MTHLNPVRAKQCTIEELSTWRWSSVRWLCNPKERPAWYVPGAALGHAGGLDDTAAGRRKYTEYLGWVTEDEPARKALAFDSMSKGWVIGSHGFKRDLIAEHREASGATARIAADLNAAREAAWAALRDQLLKRLGRTNKDVQSEGKSVDWKLAVAAALKARSTVTNRWLAEHLRMGNMYEVSRKVSKWLGSPDSRLSRLLKMTPNPKA